MPNTFIIGAPKAGTTFLYSLLLQHSSVSGGANKEPGFFTRHYDRGFDWYTDQYPESTTAKIRVDASTTYSLVGLYPEAPSRIFDASPGARFIYLVRNPYQQIESAWMQLRAQGRPISRNFSRAVHEEPLLVEGSRYWTNFSAYSEMHGDAKILLLFFADLVRSPLDTAATVFDFLDLEFESIDVFAAGTNASVGKTSPRRGLDAAHRMKHYDALVRRHIPQGIRSSLGRLLRKRLRDRPQWDAETLAWVRARVEPEAQRILAFGGRPESIWDVPETT